MSVVLATGSVFDPLYTALGWVLAQLYALIPNYAVAIILLTVAVRLVLYPLTVKQTKSMQAMQTIQPEIKRLQQKYKGDKQKQNEEMMKLYKEHQVNPLAGCLPLILQMPLFIVLYRLIHDLTGTVIVGAMVVGGVGSSATLNNPTFTNIKVDGGTVTAQHQLDGASISADVTVDGRVVGRLQGAHVTKGTVHGAKAGDPVEVVDAGNHPIGTLTDLRVEGAKKVAHPKHIPKGAALATALSRHPGEMVSWGIDLAKRPNSAKGGEAVPLYILVALTVVTGYYQQRQMTARTPASAQNPQTQMMGKIFPLFFGLISLQIPAGVVLYFVVSNLWQIGQQALIFRKQDAPGGRPGGGGAKVPAKPAPAAPLAPAGGNPQPPAKASSSSNPANRSRRRRRRRKGR